MKTTFSTPRSPSVETNLNQFHQSPIFKICFPKILINAILSAVFGLSTTKFYMYFLCLPYEPNIGPILVSWILCGPYEIRSSQLQHYLSRLCTNLLCFFMHEIIVYICSVDAAASKNILRTKKFVSGYSD